MLKKLLWKLRKELLYGLSDIQTSVNGKKSESNKYLASVKDKYLGQRCFIIGNGPSLTKEDLELLSNEVTFASNRIYKMFYKTDWRPTFYTIFDEGVAGDEGVMDGINSFECDMKFVRREGYFRYKHIKEPICCVTSIMRARKYLQNPGFSMDICNGLCSIATVTYAMLQIAVHMGFREIYLIGVDNKYRNTMKEDGTVVIDKNVKSYFGNSEKENNSAVGATWEMNIAYEYAEKFSRQNGFRIYNSTRGGYLETFERRNLDDVISNNKKGM